MYIKQKRVRVVLACLLTSILLTTLASRSTLALLAEVVRVSPDLVLIDPPAASTRMVLPRVFPDATRLGGVARKLSDALSEVGYTDQGWFVVVPRGESPTPSIRGYPISGFAVVTRLEQIDEKGVAKQESRWVADLPAPQVASFKDAIKLLLKGAPNGKYRVFLVWVSNGPVKQATSFADIDDWQESVRKGMKGPLLSALDKIGRYVDRDCSVFVYEYERSAVSGEAQFVASSHLTAEDHLKASGIWDALFKSARKEGGNK